MKACLASLFVLVTLATAFGCHETEVHVQLPPNFSGQVVLYCADRSATPSAVTVDPAGHGIGAPCADPSTRIVLIRGNERLTPTPQMHWLKTGDGIATGVEFTVR